MADEIENTLDKKEELCELLHGYSYEIHQKDDGEYHYLEDGDLCITVHNTEGSKVMYLDLQEEFTLSFGAYHEHFGCFLMDYQQLTDEIKGILANKVASASIYCHYEEQLEWMGSCTIAADEVEHKSVEQVFSYVYQIREFRDRLEKYGGEVHYIFWDSAYDRVINIEKR